MRDVNQERREQFWDLYWLKDWNYITVEEYNKVFDMITSGDLEMMELGDVMLKAFIQRQKERAREIGYSYKTK